MSNKKSKTSASRYAATQKPAAEVGFCVYIGPTIAGVIQSGTIFRGTRSEVLATAAGITEKYPMVATLIVAADTLAQDRIKVKTPGNLLYVNYHKLVSGTM